MSPDRPEKLKGPAEKHKLKYRLLSDSEMIAAKALGIAFRVDDATVNKYKTDYGIDLEADSGQKHHLLPVPSVFLVGRDGCANRTIRQRSPARCGTRWIHPPAKASS